MTRENFDEYYCIARQISKLLFNKEYDSMTINISSFIMIIFSNNMRYQVYLTPREDNKYLSICTSTGYVYDRVEFEDIKYDEWFNLSTLHNLPYSYDSVLKLFDFKHNFSIGIREV